MILGNSGQSEIQNVGLSFPVDQDIGRFKVSMHNAGLMSVSDGPANLLKQAKGVTGQQVLRLDIISQRLALHIFHRVETEPLPAATVDQADDVGMAQSLQKSDFTFKTPT